MPVTIQLSNSTRRKGLYPLVPSAFILRQGVRTSIAMEGHFVRKWMRELEIIISHSASLLDAALRFGPNDLRAVLTNLRLSSGRQAGRG